jgi:hypothetical protein
MSGEIHPETIRQLVTRTFQELGVGDQDLLHMSDTILVREGFYCGRSYRAGGLMAMWMAGLIQFYGPQGEMLRTILLAPEPQVQNKAA